MTHQLLKRVPEIGDPLFSFKSKPKTACTILTGTLCVLFVLAAALASGAHARAAATPAAAPGQTVQQGPYIPADYETLRKYYLATRDLSEKWRQLYLDAEASATALRESNTRLLVLVETQREEIEALRNKGPSYGSTGGLTWSPTGIGVFMGGSIAF